MHMRSKNDIDTNHNPRSIPRFQTALLLLGLVVAFIPICSVNAFAPRINGHHSRATILGRTRNNQRVHGYAPNQTESLASVTPPIIVEEDETENDYEPKYPPRNPLFHDTNVITRSMPLPKTSFIEKIVPAAPKLPVSVWQRFTPGAGSTKSTNSIGVDVTVEFRDASQGAKELIQRCILGNSNVNSNSNANSNHALQDAEYYNEMKEYITKVLSFFQEHITKEDALLHRYKARIVSSRGSIGQKCPRWHVDHVPLRLIISLAGPGCIYIPIEKELEHVLCVDRAALNGLDDDDTTRANGLILPYGENNVAVGAKKGDAVLLMGRAWEDRHGDGDFEEANGEANWAAPHRSPELGNDELRVLLTVDVLPGCE